MAAPLDDRRRERQEVRRQMYDDSTAHGLPAEIIETAVKRLAVLALMVALLVPAGFWAELIIQPDRLAGRIPFAVTIAVFLLGAAMSVAAWSRKTRPEVLLDVGLLFQVAVAFALSLTEDTPPWPRGLLLRGPSWNCLWISVYVITIPGTYGKNLLAAFASACMSPLALLIACVVHGVRPTQAQVVNDLLPFAAAAWSVPVARHFYRLQTQVTRAKAMGSYELLELIGKGGMGEVWSARHRMLTRISAIKLIRPEGLVPEAGGSRILLRRFEREARATAALRSPHTVALYDYGTTEEGSFYYAMELLDGLDLETLVLRFGPIPAGRTIWLLSQVVKSLAEAHDMGIVHRDIKPRNIFTCRAGTEYDFAKVLDFGLVKMNVLEQQTCLTREGVTTGTPAYMAPEIATGSPDIDGRADLYALGCVGYWLLTGQLVFEADNAMAIALAHIRNRPMPPSQRTEIEVPASLDGLILRCLEKDPAARPESGRKLLDLLDACSDVAPWTQRQAEAWWHTHLPITGAAPFGRAAAPGGGRIV
jgi:serine/threonine-protein kinase